MFARVWDILLT